MTRTTVYRKVGSRRRTSLPRTRIAGMGTSDSFAKMLEKLSWATATMKNTRRRR